MAQKIAAEIGSRGAISFARFMEIALYCPVYGYYEAEGDKIGRAGDFYTSVSVGELFGQLLACQFADWFTASMAPGDCQLPGVSCHAQGQPAKAVPSLSASAPLRLVEAGAHRGQLALDILSWLKEHRPAVFERLQYWIVEPSSRRHRWQQETLGDFGPVVQWAGSLQGPYGTVPHADPPAALTIVFSNELLDALPAYRVGWDATRRSWFEWGVGIDREQFAWTRLPLDPSQLRNWADQAGFPSLETLTTVLPDGFTLEFSPGASDWWRNAARTSGPVKLLTIDYGAEATELLIPERKDGTLRAYYRHRLSPDPLARPGEQDLTTHVNFTALERAGIAAGLHTESFVTQSEFFTSLASRIWNRELEFGEWTGRTTRQFRTLTHPEHLGRVFKVLVQQQ